MPTIFSTLGRLFRDVPARGAATLDALIERVRACAAEGADTRRRVAFSVAMIALSAKMAKADGVVTADEVAAFRRIFAIPAGELRNVFRLYDLAKGDIAGFEAYARKLAALCRRDDEDCGMLEDVLDGLFHIAGADGVVHERERIFLGRVASLFGLSEARFTRIEARHVRGMGNPYAVLGADPADPPEVLRRRYLELVRENHPDRLAARGVPQEFMALATERMKAINAAWSSVGKMAAT